MFCTSHFNVGHPFINLRDAYIEKNIFIWKFAARGKYNHVQQLGFTVIRFIGHVAYCIKEIQINLLMLFQSLQNYYKMSHVR